MSAAMLTGTSNADEIISGRKGVEYTTNNAGGILGGISNGADIICRFAVKPTSSICLKSFEFLNLWRGMVWKKKEF